MAAGYAVRNITITTGAVGTTFTISGLSFAPVAGHVFHCGRTAVGGAEQDVRGGHGVFTGTASRRSYTSQIDHAVGTTATDNVRSNDSVVHVLSPAGASAGKLDVDAMLSDGVRFVVDEAFALACVLSVELWGGDVSEAQIVDFTEPGATGNQDIATSFALNTGIDDKAVIFLGSSISAFGTVGADALNMYGVAAGNTPVNAIAFWASLNAKAAGQTYRYARTGECIGQGRVLDTIASRASVTAWLSTGFRLDWAEVDAGEAWEHSALVMKGGRWEVGDITSVTNANNQTEATTYTPVGLSFGSVCATVSTVDAVNQDGEFCIGAAAGAAERAAITCRDKDTADPTDAGAIHFTDAFWVDVSQTAATVDNQADLVSMDSTPGFTWVMDVNDGASARYIFYLLVADAPATATRQQTLTLIVVGA